MIRKSEKEECDHLNRRFEAALAMWPAILEQLLKVDMRSHEVQTESPDTLWVMTTKRALETADALLAELERPREEQRSPHVSDHAAREVALEQLVREIGLLEPIELPGWMNDVRVFFIPVAWGERARDLLGDTP